MPYTYNEIKAIIGAKTEICFPLKVNGLYEAKKGFIKAVYDTRSYNGIESKISEGSIFNASGEPIAMGYNTDRIKPLSKWAELLAKVATLNAKITDAVTEEGSL